MGTSHLKHPGFVNASTNIKLCGIHMFKSPNLDEVLPRYLPSEFPDHAHQVSRNRKAISHQSHRCSRPW
eukprot:2626205-Amphidinium_carterae.4